MSNPSHGDLWSSHAPFFTNRLPEDVRDAVLTRVQVLEYRADEIIHAAGSPADAAYYIAEGMVQLDDRGHLGDAFLNVGEYFGESDVLHGANYTATAIAVTDLQLLVLAKRDLDALLADEKYAAFALALMRHVAQKLERAQRGFTQAPERRPAATALSRTRRTVRRTSAFASFAPWSRGTTLGLAALLGVFLIGTFLSLSVLAVATTKVRVEGLSLSTPAPQPPRLLTSKTSATKVARWVDSSAAIPTAAAPAAPPAQTTHAVAAGDTLSGIAQMHWTTLATIRTLNGLDGDVIRAGTQLSVPVSDQPPRAVALAPIPTRTPRPQPTAAPQPTAVPAPALAAPLAPTQTPLDWKMPPWTSVEPAKVAAGQKYWRLSKAVYFDEASAGGRINILVAALGEDGKELADIPVKMEWGAGEYTTRNTEDKRDPFLLPYNLSIIAAHDMAAGSSFAPDRGERGGYKISAEGLPSEVVSGLGLPLRHHVAFLLVFQRTTK